MLISVKLKIS